MTDIKKYENAKISSGYGQEMEKPQNSMALIKNMMVKKQKEIEALLPKSMSPRRLGILTLKTIRKVPKLLECDPYSLMGAILQAAQLGLEPDGMLGHAHLVPFGREATLMIGYRGMIDIAIRSGQVKSVGANIVYQGDDFEYIVGQEEKFMHKPKFVEERGEPIAVYAYARMKSGDFVVDVLTLDDIHRAQKSSRSPNIWRDHWGEMAKKTAFRRLFKWLPISEEMSKAVSLDEQADYGGQNLGLDLQDEDELVREPITVDVVPKEPSEKEEPVKTENKKDTKKRGRPKKQQEPETKQEPVPATEQPAKESKQEATEPFQMPDKIRVTHPSLQEDKPKQKPADPDQKSFFGD